MISLSVVKVRVSDKKCILTRNELAQVRTVMSDVHNGGGSPKELEKRMQKVLAAKHTFANGKKYSLLLDTVKLGENFYVWSSRHTLTANEIAHIKNIVNCAIMAPSTMLLFPDYIIISPVPPPDLKPKRKKKADGTK